MLGGNYSSKKEEWLSIGENVYWYLYFDHSLTRTKHLAKLLIKRFARHVYLFYTEEKLIVFTRTALIIMRKDILYVYLFV